MADWRNFDYYRCPVCKTTWRQESIGSYDPGDAAPVYLERTCSDECHDELLANEPEDDDVLT